MDYSSGLVLKMELLLLSSCQLVEAHYKLSIMLDLMAGQLADAIHHVQHALESIKAHLVRLQAGLAGMLLLLPEPSDTKEEDKDKGKGKAKAKEAMLAPEEVQNWSQSHELGK